MNRDNARARVSYARMELDAAEQQLAAHWQPWRERIDCHRVSLLIGSGLLGGLALAMMPPKRWARAGAALFGGSAWLARSAIVPAVFGALWTNIQSSTASARAPATVSPVPPSAHP